jgi:ribonucleotide reductase beta subunit family protein with ferritin-like domain
MPGLSNYCDQISRDKSLHRNLVIDLFNDYLQEKVPADKARQIILGTRNLSLEVFLKDFPVSLIEMQEDHLEQYVNLVTEDLLQNLGYDKHLAEEAAVLSEPNIALAQSRASKLQQNGKKDSKENKEFGEDANSRSQ